MGPLLPLWATHSTTEDKCTSRGGAKQLSYRKTALSGNYCACKIIKRHLSGSKFALIADNTHPTAAGPEYSASSALRSGVGLEEQRPEPGGAAASLSKGL